jgi:hypothetical protein
VDRAARTQECPLVQLGRLLLASLDPAVEEERLLGQVVVVAVGERLERSIVSDGGTTERAGR